MSANGPDGQPTEPWAAPPLPPPPPPAPPAYGQPYAYGYQPYAPPQTEGMATAALVTSILSFVFCPVVAAVVALVLASSARKRIVASGGRLTGESLVTAAKWISWINLGLWGAVIAIVVVIAILGAAASSSSPDFSMLHLTLR